VAEGHERLNALLGLWGAETAWSPAPRLPELPADAPDLEGIEKRAVAASLDLAAMRQEIRAAGERIGIADVSRWLPRLDAGVAAQREEGPWSAGPSLSLPIPLFDMGQARRAVAESDFRRRLDSYHALAVSVRAGVRAAAQRFLAARSRALFYRDEVLPLAGRIVDETQLEYNAMLVGVFQLLAAKERQIDAGGRYVEALRDYWLARGDLEQSLRGRLVRRGTPSSMARRESDGAGAASPGGH
jgi:cobalt-zinc-cadmium efflux system outer membrane protein